MNCTRRTFFTAFARSLADGIASLAPTRPTTCRPFLRPPGALEEERFIEACTRCTDCLEACPHQAIRRLGPEFGQRAGTPAILPDEVPCMLCEDLPCITACDEGALINTPKRQVKMGTARIDLRHCYQAQGQPCDYCVTRCPLKGEAIDWDERGLPAVDACACVGCGVCQYLCPAPALAIEVVPAELTGPPR